MTKGPGPRSVTRGDATEATQRVNRAIAIAVRRLLDSAGDAKSRDGLAHSIGKRIRGSYGFDLRRQADLYPERTPEELYALVIVPHEFPWDAEAAIDAAGSTAGDRDKVRAHRDGPFLDPDDPTLTPRDEIPARVAELRAALKGTRP